MSKTPKSRSVVQAVPPPASATADDLARELIAASRAIEALATRSAAQLESTFMAYARALRARGEASLKQPDGSSDEVYLD